MVFEDEKPGEEAAAQDDVDVAELDEEPDYDPDEEGLKDIKGG